MRYLRHVTVLFLCMGILVCTANGQSNGFYRTHQSGAWTDGSTWERYNGTTWVWPAPTPIASTSDGILIVTGHKVAITSKNITADQMQVDGTLEVRAGTTLTIADGPGVDLLQDHPGSLIQIRGKLVNQGTIQIKQGGFAIGTVENDGDITVGGIFQFTSGTFTGNDIRYGLTGSLVVDFPGYVIEQEDHFWPAADGPPTVRVTKEVTLNGHRTVKETLEVSGDLHVVGSLTSNGETRVPGTLQLTGAFVNNGETDISGTVQLNTPAAVVTGKPLVYSGCCSQLDIRGPGGYVIQEDNLIWPETAPPAIVSVPGFGDNAASVTLHAVRSTGQLDPSSSATFQVAGQLTVNNGGRIKGLLLVDGMFFNNGIIEIDKCQVSGNLINNGALTIGDRFQVEDQGDAGGNDFTYSPSSRLIFSNSSIPQEVDAESAHWPADNGPPNVEVRGAGGVAVNVPRTVPRLLQVGGPVSNAGNITIAREVQVNSGGSFASSPVYVPNTILRYNTGAVLKAGPEWAAGDTVGLGVPQHVVISPGATVTMPDEARRCPGALSVQGTLVLSGDLSLGGDLENQGTIVPNSSRVIMDGTIRQRFIWPITLHDLTIDNPAGIAVSGRCGDDAARTDSLTVNGLLNFVDGHLIVGDCDGVLILNGPVSGYSDSSFIATYYGGRVWGTVERGKSYQFPIGPFETSYNPVTLTLDPGQVGGLTAMVRVDAGVLNDSIDAASSVLRTWTVNPECFNGRLTFQWKAEEEGPDFRREDVSVYSDGYYEDMEIQTEGAASGTDPYTISTTGELPCLEYPLYKFVVSNARELTDVPELVTPNFFLDQNEPNPFNASTTIRYSIPEANFVQLTIYDALGREVEKLVNERQPKGEYEKEWNPAGLIDGLYFCRLQAGNRIAVRRLIRSGF